MTKKLSLRHRITTVLIAGILAFVGFKLWAQNDLELAAGFGAGLLAWLVTAPQKEEEKK